jgi:protein arginine N-methyltransferase 5
MGSRKRVSCGQEFSHVPELQNLITQTAEAGFDFVTVPIVNPRYEREFNEDKSASKRTGPFTRADILLASTDWSSLVVGKLSPTIDVDSEVEYIRKNSESRLFQELRYASHLGLPAIQLKLYGLKHTNLARILSNYIQKGANFQLWLQVPLNHPKDEVGEWLEGEDRTRELDEEGTTWEWWNNFRLITSSSNKVNLCLEMSEKIPPESEVLRWLGEPVKTLIVSTKLFLTNKKGYPVLSRQVQTLLRRFIPLDIQVIVKGPCRHELMKHYQQYLDHLWQQFQVDAGDPLQQFARGYEDYLQCPLQPLMDNLESQTYEVFEKDPVKYSEYQTAITAALTDMVEEKDIDKVVLTLMVVGAGRGPLVRAAINASIKSGRKIRVFAVEKNPNAVVTLEQQKAEMWGEQVTVISSDMRDWNPPEADYADILVSELLGSFGDNELSPECLDGAQKFLKTGGISIPASYTSYIGPLQSSKLYNEVRNCKDEMKGPQAGFETPYVVHFQNRYELAPPQPLFTFSHPNRSKMIDNSRYSILKFKTGGDSVLHGFGGYFECTLYKNTMISILPATHNPGMFSWFPIFFPLREPIQMKKDDDLTLHFWRLVSKKSVWYEWAVSSPVTASVHNPNGRSYEIGL